MLRVLTCCVLLLAAAQPVSVHASAPPLPADDLLTGTELFGSAAVAAPLPPDAVFGIDDGIRAFLAEHVRSGTADGKLRQLLAGMEHRGLFSMDYTTEATRTVRETFYEERGNCLSFTMLFVTLARELGLHLRYQIVEMPPNWSITSDDWVLVSNHINARVKNAFSTEYVVDFNQADFKGNYPTREVSDAYALALFYNNRGAEALIASDYSVSFSNLRAAIATYPDFPDPWVNLGLLYARRELYVHAESAYLHALEADSTNRSALTNLARLYVATGDEERAATYLKRIRRYQQRNPYYHYSLAQRAYDEQRFPDALALLRTAMRLKRNEHQFHFLEGLARYELGETREALRSIERAREYAELAEVKARYAAKLEELASN